ncbi:hypothetical protein [Acutalibacter caecimuris]|uniref:hypothetical protein n=1 Tax=Acutalibacter caecimuris TaxID=3093657 RepID=UPI002AC98798|nr:hypothetical protein [Acutalibacter sp. M00118]
MNKEQIFFEFRKKAESDNHYFNFGRFGIIEEILAYFGLPSKEFKGTSSWVHEDNLTSLHDFLINNASDEQLALVHQIATGQSIVPTMNPVLPSSGSVFVSMPMNKEKYDCVDAIRTGTQAAIVASKNQPYYLDLDAHNENISVKMFEEIRSCKFLVADFTYQNAGVYYEAGYAKGIGKTVIHLCRSDEFTHLHFDVKQIQFVVWNDMQDLTTKLEGQIRKSGLSGQ